MSSVTVPRSAPLAPTSSDRVRQVVVVVGALLAMAGAAFGSGAFGGQQVEDAAGGALSADATPLAPDTPAFRIWSVIYLGLLAYAVYQALPRNAARPRLRATGWWVLASMVLNAAWIGVVQQGWVVGSVVVIATLLAVLAVLLVRLVRTPPDSAAQAVVTDGTIGLYLGWVSVATLANIAATLVVLDVGGLGLGATAWSVVVLTLASALAVAYAVFARTRPVIAVAIGFAMAWGLAWIAVGRTSGSPEDPVVAGAAAAASVVAIAAPVVTTLLARRSAR
ncbi:tryptophan-rich sensory protein [Cellulomonas algicola]|uniref:Tryptophan-rich sensory protein n=1 Tax=Cellulomonas algicola TaxID=2071633 RepID=A0A401V4Q0_9CELL|nr:tryptophan-rich sensory protein [Cellulomonas algicola]GCD21899.1 tryptophan-rich sensory protein [Cellulomonas algicola]